MPVKKDPCFVLRSLSDSRQGCRVTGTQGCVRYGRYREVALAFLICASQTGLLVRRQNIGMQGQNRSRPAFRDRQEDPLTAGLHSRGYLPHLKSEGGSYFVTFRLFGTLPKELLLRLKREREIIVQEAEVAKRPMTRAEHEELFIWYSTKVDQILDEGRHGVPWLAKSRIADLVVAALRHFEGERYFLHAFAVMPNHLHAVVRPQPPNTLSAILHSWKSYTASEANKLLNRVGEHFWQKESFDHFCRNEDDLNRCVRYTLDNPVKARLCARWEDWRWSSAWRGAT